MKDLTMVLGLSVPQQMRWLEKKSLFLIAWKDGHTSEFSLQHLRKCCPCALCREERENDDPFKLISSEASVNATAIVPVGQYAIQIRWSDGHTSGIYSLDLLRKLCVCEGCK